MTLRAPAFRLAILVVAVTACTRGGGARATDDPAAQNARGAAYTSKGQLDQAMAVLDSAIARKPDLADAYANRAVVYRRKKDYARAIADLDRALAIKPDAPNVLYSRGFTYQIAQDQERALASYNQALALKPDMPLAVKNRGRVYFYLGQLPQAEADHVAGIKADPTNPFLPLWLHMIRMRLGEDDHAEFVANLARTDTTAWPAPVGRFYLGRLTPEAFAKSADLPDTTTRRVDRCEDFFIGEWLLWQHKPAEAAPRFQAAVAKCPAESSEYAAARGELSRLTPAVGATPQAAPAPPRANR